jgi:periplasmic protein TonB
VLPASPSVPLAPALAGVGTADPGGGRAPGGGWRRLNRDDRRLLLCFAASLLAHTLLVAEWGFDIGQRPAQSQPALTARLQPAAAETAAAETLLTALAPDGVLPEVPPEVPPAARDAASAAVLPAAGPDAAPAAVPQPNVEAAASPPAQAPPLPDPAQLDRTPRSGPERSGSADLTWYTGRDLDVLPRPLSPIEPVFPVAAQARGVSGRVTLAVSIDISGRVTDVDVLRAEPPGLFDEAAVNAFRAARYVPGYKDGRAVRARVQTVVVFELNAQK